MLMRVNSKDVYDRFLNSGFKVLIRDDTRTVDTARSSIAYHIGKIFKEGELEKDTSVEIFDTRMHLLK